MEKKFGGFPVAGMKKKKKIYIYIYIYIYFFFFFFLQLGGLLPISQLWLRYSVLYRDTVGRA